MDEKQQAIEKIASEIGRCHDEEKPCEFCKIIARNIVNLKSDSGNPLLGIIAADQSLPEIKGTSQAVIEITKIARQEMINEGWVKILK